MRVVSLVPSTTETLLAWGVDVVACSRFCEQPQLPHVGGTKDPDVAAIAALRPDLVVLDREENRRDDATALHLAGLSLHVTHVRSLADVAPTLRRLAAACGLAGDPTDDPAWRAFDEDAMPPRAAAPADPPTAPVLAWVPIWRRPWMAIGGRTYGSTLLAHLGIGNVFDEHPDDYPSVDLSGVAVGERRPSLVLLPSEPYPFAERHVPEVSAALPAAEVVLVDGRDLFWWGVRTPGAVARLRDVLRRGSPPR